MKQITGLITIIALALIFVAFSKCGKETVELSHEEAALELVRELGIIEAFTDKIERTVNKESEGYEVYMSLPQETKEELFVFYYTRDFSPDALNTLVNLYRSPIGQELIKRENEWNSGNFDYKASHQAESKMRRFSTSPLGEAWESGREEIEKEAYLVVLEAKKE